MLKTQNMETRSSEGNENFCIHLFLENINKMIEMKAYLGSDVISFSEEYVAKLDRISQTADVNPLQKIQKEIEKVKTKPGDYELFFRLGRKYRRLWQVP